MVDVVQVVVDAGVVQAIVVDKEDVVLMGVVDVLIGDVALIREDGVVVINVAVDVLMDVVSSMAIVVLI